MLCPEHPEEHLPHRCLTVLLIAQRADLTTPKTQGTYQFVPGVSLALGFQGKDDSHQKAGPSQGQQGG